MVKFSRTEIFNFLADAKVLEEWDANDGFVDRSRQAVEDAVGRVLTDRMRQVYVMYYLDGISTTQIAEMLGVNRSTVSRTISRGRRNIMEKMK